MPLQDANPTPSFGGFGLRGNGVAFVGSVLTAIKGKPKISSVQCSCALEHGKARSNPIKFDFRFPRIAVRGS